MGGMREQLGAAVNASNLGGAVDRERHVDRVGAMGAACIKPGGIDPRGELGSALIRLRWGEQDVFKQAALLLVRDLRNGSMRGRFRFERRQDADIVLLRFACAVLDEWLHDKCPECTGRGRKMPADEVKRDLCQACNGLGRRTAYLMREERLERDEATGLARVVVDRWISEHVDTRGTIAKTIRCKCSTCNGTRVVEARRRANTAAGPVCRSCRGTGDRRITLGDRVVMLGLPREIVEKHWIRHFETVKARLSALDGLVVSRSRFQLEKRLEWAAGAESPVAI